MQRRHIVWNVDNINRLQDFWASTPQNETNYFGYQVGEAIVDFCSYFVSDIKKCEVLDYGCGLGHIMYCFCKKEINVWGVDMSEEAVRAATARCGDSVFFHGVMTFDGGKLPYDDNRFDLITCTECIEHILPEHMDVVLDEIYRVLKPGGRLLITTRNEENFALSELCCPECNTIYHRVGHVNWYSVDILKKLMESHCYKTIMCHGTDFWQFQKYLKHPPILDMTLRQIYRQCIRAIDKLTDIRRGTVDSKIFKKNMELRKRPNLFWVGTK